MRAGDRIGHGMERAFRNRLYGLAETARLLGVSRDMIRVLMTTDGFPLGVMTHRGLRWSSPAIAAWLERRAAP